MGDNYDVVTILPHATVSENVILVVRDRLNANEVKEVIDKLAKAAEKTRGTLSFRNGKLFGHFTIVVNKCQVIGHEKRSSFLVFQLIRQFKNKYLILKF